MSAGRRRRNHSGDAQNRKRVSPPGSTPHVTSAERGSMRYTCHGGGPCNGALNGAVMPAPLSSGSAGQPPSAQALPAQSTGGSPSTLPRLTISMPHTPSVRAGRLNHDRSPDQTLTDRQTKRSAFTKRGG